MREDIARPIVTKHVDVDRKASREYVTRKERKPEKAVCCRCGKVWPVGLMATVGMDCYECRMCLYA